MAEFVNQTVLNASKQRASQDQISQAHLQLQQQQAKLQQENRDFLFNQSIAADSKYPLDVRVERMNKNLQRVAPGHFVTADQLEPVLPLFKGMLEAQKRGEPLDRFGDLINNYLDKGLISAQAMPEAMDKLSQIHEQRTSRAVDAFTMDPEVEAVRMRHGQRQEQLGKYSTQLEQLNQTPDDGLPTTKANLSLQRTQLQSQIDDLVHADEQDAYQIQLVKLHDERADIIKQAVRNDPKLLGKMQEQKLGELGVVGLDENGRKTQWTRLASIPNRTDEQERAFNALSLVVHGKTSGQLMGESKAKELQAQRSQLTGQREIIAGALEKDGIEQKAAAKLAADGEAAIPPAPTGNFLNPSDFDPSQESTITAIGNLIEPAKQQLMAEAQPMVQGIQEIKARYVNQASALRKQSTMRTGTDKVKMLDEAKRMDLLGDALDAQAVLALDAHPIMGQAIKLNQKVLQREIDYLEQYQGTSPERDVRLATTKGALEGANMQFANWEANRTKALTTLKKTQYMLEHDEKQIGAELSKFDNDMAQGERFAIALRATLTDTAGGMSLTQATRENGKLYGLDDKRLGELVKQVKEVRDFDAKNQGDKAIAHGQGLLAAQLGELPPGTPPEKISQMAAEVQKTVQKLYKVPVKIEDITKGARAGNTMQLQLLSPTERKDIAEDRTMVGQINELIAGFKPGYVGVFDEKLGRIGQMTGMLGQEREDWLQRSRALLTDLRHSRFGASLTEGEKEAAMNELPNETMGDNQWQAAAKAWRDKWGRLIDERMKVAGQARGGKAAPGKVSTGNATIDSLVQEYGGQ